MRYEPGDMMRNHERLNDESLDGLPDALAELALQLGSDADRLAEIYAARPPAAEDVLARPAVARGFWPSVGRIASVSRIAAAVCIAAGLAIAVYGPSMWRGMFGSSPDRQPLVDAQGGPDHSLADVHSSRPSAMQPILISTEAMRQFSGEETEILADAIPHGESAVVIADL